MFAHTKQHITIDQLNELSETGRNRLGIWCVKTTCPGIPPDIIGPDEVLPLLSIGQCLELLYDLGEVNEFYYHRTEPWYRIALTNRSINNGHTGHTWFNSHSEHGWEPLDALWEACKEVLNTGNKLPDST